MNNLTTATLFYLLIFVFIYQLYKTGLLRAIIIKKNAGHCKYHLGILLFLFLHINLLFYCSFCNHRNTLILTLSLSAVIAGAGIYLTHLFWVTIESLGKIHTGDFDFMPPFFSIPYLILLYDILTSVTESGIGRMHSYEQKMLIVLLYPFFMICRDFTCKLRLYNKPALKKKSTVSGNEGKKTRKT